MVLSYSNRKWAQVRRRAGWHPQSEGRPPLLWEGHHLLCRWLSRCLVTFSFCHPLLLHLNPIAGREFESLPGCLLRPRLFCHSGPDPVWHPPLHLAFPSWLCTSHTDFQAGLELTELASSSPELSLVSASEAFPSKVHSWMAFVTQVLYVLLLSQSLSCQPS